MGIDRCFCPTDAPRRKSRSVRSARWGLSWAVGERCDGGGVCEFDDYGHTWSRARKSLYVVAGISCIGGQAWNGSGRVYSSDGSETECQRSEEHTSELQSLRHL